MQKGSCHPTSRGSAFTTSLDYPTLRKYSASQLAANREVKASRSLPVSPMMMYLKRYAYAMALDVCANKLQPLQDLQINCELRGNRQMTGRQPVFLFRCRRRNNKQPESEPYVTRSALATLHDGVFKVASESCNAINYVCQIKKKDKVVHFSSLQKLKKHA